MTLDTCYAGPSGAKMLDHSLYITYTDRYMPTIRMSYQVSIRVIKRQYTITSASMQCQFPTCHIKRQNIIPCWHVMLIGKITYQGRVCHFKCQNVGPKN